VRAEIGVALDRRESAFDDVVELPRRIRAAEVRMRILIGALILASCVPAVAADSPDWPALGNEAVRLLTQYLAFDTTNPPGNETKAAEFLKAVFDREGIEARVLEPEPGRGSIYARLPGDGTRRAVILLNHLDVVPAERQFWSTEPFGGQIRDGYVWGRGALDMKGMGVIELMTLVILKRHNIALKGDVLFLGTAGEETGGRVGAGFVVNDHLDLVKDAGLVLNEGGAIAIRGGSVVAYEISLSEKIPLGVTLRALGIPGHGSMPRPLSAVDRLISALHRVIAYEPPFRVLPEVQQFYATMADDMASPARERLRDLETSLHDETFAREFTRDPVANARVRNTIAVTVLEASTKVNVIPPQAVARLDVRLLPGEDPAAFVAELRRVIADESVQIETGAPHMAPGSPFPRELFAVIGDVARELSPSDPVPKLTTPLLTGATDCRYFRERAIPCYGFMPFKLGPDDYEGFHGNDERLSVENVWFGTRALYEIVKRLAE
jgi:acetylornithine deacetylase/succinyl-diaminopimelate desuccinylase-like protein